MFDFDTPLSRHGTHSVKYDLRRARFGRDDVLPLWVADMDFATAPCVQAALAERAAHPLYGYTLSDEGVFAAIIDWQWRRHGWRIEREWITLLPGVVPALALCAQAFATPGEALLTPTPVYNPVFESAAHNGLRVLRSPLRDTAEGYVLDFDQMETVVDAGTRLLTLCNPHNPGGRVWTAAELTRLGEFCVRHDLIVLSDEIHADLVFPGHGAQKREHRPLALLAPEFAARTVTLNSSGKTFNIAGLGIAYAITPNAELRQRLAQAVHRLHWEGPNLFALTALKAAYREGEPWLAALLDYLQGNIALVRETLARVAPHIGCPAPQATFLMWLDCRALGLEDAALRQRLTDAGLGLTPGTQFGPEGSGYMRLNVALRRATLREAMQRLGEALQA